MCLLAKYIIAIVVLIAVSQGAMTPAVAASGENRLPPMAHAVFCLSYPENCRQSPSTRLFPDTPQIRAQLEFVNRRVNDSIAPQPDRATLDDRWQVAPLEGRCHDYAVTKQHYLREAGWPSSSLLLAEVTLKSGEHHLILVVQTESDEFVLDNLNSTIVPMIEARNEYYWNRVQSSADPKYWGSESRQ
jgi:predicted transglutaminase-like cysteine proteinase